jgi:molybdopterin-guanine dinucleotide biosynthesis protein A
VQTATAAILAGGRGRRLGGRNKATLRVGERSLLDRQLAALQEVVGRTVIIASDPLPYRDVGVPVVPDDPPGRGALGALHTAIQAGRPGGTLVVACDMPFLSALLLRYLAEAGDTADIVIPRTSRGYEPLCATYSARCAAGVQDLLEAGDLRLSSVTGISGLTIRELGPDEVARFGREDVLFFNINTPEDYARASELAAEYRSLPG